MAVFNCVLGALAFNRFVLPLWLGLLCIHLVRSLVISLVLLAIKSVSLVYH